MKVKESFIEIGRVGFGKSKPIKIDNLTSNIFQAFVMNDFAILFHGLNNEKVRN